MPDQAAIDTLLRVRDRHMTKLLNLKNTAGESAEQRVCREEDAIAAIAKAIAFLRQKW